MQSGKTDLLSDLQDVLLELEPHQCGGILGNTLTCKAPNATEKDLSPSLARRAGSVIERAIQALKAEETVRPQVSPGEELSKRQREILYWVASGKSNTVIADILMISHHTVDTHLRRAFERLGTSDRTVAAIRAIEAGMIDPHGLRAA